MCRQQCLHSHLGLLHEQRLQVRPFGHNGKLCGEYVQLFVRFGHTFMRRVVDMLLKHGHHTLRDNQLRRLHPAQRKSSLWNGVELQQFLPLLYTPLRWIQREAQLW